jgi:hypothetical protein
MATARYDHTATLLPNGLVLLAGDSGRAGVLTRAELYDPTTGVCTATGGLAAARTLHTATLLPNGQVLVAGGFGCCPVHRVGTSERYDPESGGWTATASLLPGRFYHTATLLPNGQVLASGGDSDYGVLAGAELYKSAP